MAAAPVVRAARPADVPAIGRFGEAYVRPHYAPLIGASAADAQVRDWWNARVLEGAVTAGLVVVAVDDDQIVGVGQRGRSGVDHVVYKLYLADAHRGRGLGPALLDALITQLPPDAERVCIEHFAGNARAGAFYEREGFTVERVTPSPSGDARLAVVWRCRPLAPPG